MKSHKNKRGPGRPLRLPKCDEHLTLWDPFIIWGYRGISQELGVSERTVLNWIHKYGLPVEYAPSGRCWVLRGQLQRWLFYFKFFKEGFEQGKTEAEIKDELAKLRGTKEGICPQCGAAID